MSHQDVRTDLAKRLRRQDVPDPVWDRLIEDRDVDAVLTGGAEEFGDLVRTAKRWLTYYRDQAAWERKQRATKKPQRLSPDLSEYLIERARARDEALASKAARSQEIRTFRRRILGGGPLSIPLARRLLESDAACEWSARNFERLGVPIVGHEGTVTSQHEALELGRFIRTFDLTVTWGEQVLKRRITYSAPSKLDAEQLYRELHFVDEHGERFYELVRLGSVLDRLRELSEWLVRTYDFDVAQAAWFILTDSPPRRPPLEGSIAIEIFPTHVDGRVTLSMDLWVPADAVLEAFRQVQRHRLNGENRPLSLRNLAVFRSVVEDAREAERTNPGGPLPSRTRSMARWNREHPEAAYKQEWQFNRDVDRAERAVLFPSYRLDGANKKEDG